MVSKDLSIADFYASVRSFRIVDGAVEVQKCTLAWATFKDIHTEGLESLPQFGE